MFEKVTAAIPTIGRVEILPTLITALAFQSHKVDELLILDEAKTPIMESYAVNQAMDLLSLQGTEVRLIRSRNRRGIGAARLQLAKEAKNDLVLMVDDDVVPNPEMLYQLLNALAQAPANNWAVPTCILLNASLELDGYMDKPVAWDSHEVQIWVRKYPWFIPYFQYTKEVILPLKVAGTQAILLRRDALLEKAGRMGELGNLPREDTYMTRVMGEGIFTSLADCYHFEHKGQIDRGNWGSSMFYRIHEAIIEDPEAFVSFMGRK